MSLHEDDFQQDREVSEWMRFGMRLGISAALHPFEYAKVLIQLGYEPIPAVPGRSILGKPIMILPNIFQYAGHIRKVDGLSGSYRGLTPKLVGTICTMMFSEKIANRMGLHAIEDKKDDELLTDKELHVQFKVNLKRDVVLSVSGIIISQPFHVISVRMMAQFIGRENIYKTILGSIAEIYRTEGIFGFFSGLVPKLLCDVACLVLSSSTVFLLNKYIVKDKFGRQYSAALTQFAFTSILYPLSVVSTCMTVTGSRLLAGQPPVMPIYKNWISCFNDLQARNELKRGSSLFWRSAGGFVKHILKVFAINLTSTKEVYIMEKHCIDSFEKWPFNESSPCSIAKMAEAGFSWTGNRNKEEDDDVTYFVCSKLGSQ